MSIVRKKKIWGSLLVLVILVGSSVFIRQGFLLAENPNVSFHAIQPSISKDLKSRVLSFDLSSVKLFMRDQRDIAYDSELKGLQLNVSDFEILSDSEFIDQNPEMKDIVEKVRPKNAEVKYVLFEADFCNTSHEEITLSPLVFQLETRNVSVFMALQIFLRLNEVDQGVLTIGGGERKSLTFVYELYDGEFYDDEWRNAGALSFALTIFSYPNKYSLLMDW